MTLDQILAQIGDEKYPPVEQWQPAVCGDIDIEIARDGRWYHEGGEIKRRRLVTLFASILKREERDYFLVTPVEKMRIRVESTPFIVTQADIIDGAWVMTNNLGEQRVLDAEHRLDLTDDDNPQINWRANLPARIHRNVMYYWQQYALEHDGLQADELWLHSGGERFLLARL